MEKTIGTFEDLQHDQVIYFVYSDTLSRIVSYKTGQTTELILEWEGFGWSENTLITGVGMVGDILIWCEGLEREVRAINITKRELYNSVKETDDKFINLIKRPPLLPLTATRVDLNSTKPNLILDHSFVFSYRYVYEDDEVSVFAPWSEPVYLPYNGQGQDDFKDITVTQALPSEPIPPLVKKIEFLVKRDTETVWYSIKTVDVNPNTTVSQYSFNFDNSFLGNAINEDDSVRLFDAIWPAGALTVARNRVFIGNYAEGYDEQGDADMTITLNTAAPVGSQIVLKSNTSQRLGIAFYDVYGRSSGVLSKTDWQINTFPTIHETTPTNYSSADVSINITAPSWATSWRLVKTDDLIYSFFIQDHGYMVVEQEIEEQDYLYLGRVRTNPPNDTTEDRYSIVKKLYIDTNNLIKRSIGYTFSQGDRVNVYYPISDDTAPNNLRWGYVLGLPILSQRGSLIEVPINSEILPTSEPDEQGYFNSEVFRLWGVLFEIYSPNNSASGSRFFETEIGGEIVDSPFSVEAEIKGTVWLNQLTDYYRQGYRILTPSGLEFNSPAATPNVAYRLFFKYESMSPWDRYYTQWLQGLGRASLVLSDNLRKKVYKPTYERFSNKYLPGTQINGISSFEGLNEKDLPLENGEIKKLILASNSQSEGTVLLAVMQNETESQYLGETQFKDTQGQTVGAITDSVIGSTNTLRGGYGTLHPESVVKQDGRVYWWDATKGEVVRYSNDGLTPLARLHKMQNFFREVSRRQLELINDGRATNVYGGYDPEMDEFILTFADVIDGEDILFEGFTIAYSEKIQGFSTFYSFKPEFYCKSNTRFVSFLGGKLYLHGENPIHNNFYGVQYTSTIKFLSNQNPHLVKVWNSVVIEGEEVWVPKEIANDKGQLSYMRKQWFENREGVFYGAIRRDVNSFGYADERIALNNGDVLRSQVLEVTIENDSTSEARLDVVNMIYIESLGHVTIN